MTELHLSNQCILSLNEGKCVWFVLRWFQGFFFLSLFIFATRSKWVVKVCDDSTYLLLWRMLVSIYLYERGVSPDSRLMIRQLHRCSWGILRPYSPCHCWGQFYSFDMQMVSMCIHSCVCVCVYVHVSLCGWAHTQICVRLHALLQGCVHVPVTYL